MSIDSIGSCSCSSSTQSTTLDSIKQRFQDFKALGKAVQSGDMTSAQTALTTVQTDIQNASSTSRLGKLFADGTQGSEDLQALQDAIQNNDTSGAQKAMEALKQDLKGTQKTHGHHGHHKVDNDGDADDGAAAGSTTSTPTTGSTTSTDSESPAVSALNLLA